MSEPRTIHWLLALSLALATHLAVARWFERPRPPLTPVELTASGLRLSLGDVLDDGGTGGQPDGDPDSDPDSDPDTAEAPPVTPEPDPEPKPAPVPRPPTTPRPAPPPPKPVNRPAVPRPSTPATPPRGTASRSGGKPAAGDNAGSGGRPAAATAGSGPALNAYTARIAALLERQKRYPRQAQRLRQEGTVRVRFTVERSGAVVSPRIERSSGHALLDQAALELLRRVSPLPPLPPELGARLDLVVPIAYQLR